jgi:hypothetical protein
VTPDEVVASATVAGVIVAVLVGISGFVVGLVGLHHANKAKEAAAPFMNCCAASTRRLRRHLRATELTSRSASP